MKKLPIVYGASWFLVGIFAGSELIPIMAFAIFSFIIYQFDQNQILKEEIRSMKKSLH